MLDFCWRKNSGILTNSCQFCWANTMNLTEFIKMVKGTMLATIVNNALGQFWTYARNLAEERNTCLVEVNRLIKDQRLAG